MSDPRVPQRLLKLAQARTVRALTNDGLRERFGDLVDVEVEVGQVWRARWEEVVALLLVLSIQDHDVIMAPVTIDPPTEDDHCLIIDPGHTVFGVDVTLWAGMSGPIPVRVLERPVDVWNERIVGWASQEGATPSAHLPEGTRRGRAIPSLFESDALLRAELEDDLDALRAAPGLPVETGADRPFQSLASLLGKNPKLDALCSALGWQQHEVMTLLHGKRPLGPEMVDAIVQATGLAAADVAQAVRPLPRGLVIEVDHPRWRSTWRALARSSDKDEAAVRLMASYGTFALAARQTGTGDVDWRSRLQQFLRDRLAE